MNRNIGIHTPDSFRGGLCFPNAQQGNFGQQLTVQIGGSNASPSTTRRKPMPMRASISMRCRPDRRSQPPEHVCAEAARIPLRSGRGHCAHIWIHRSAASHRGKQSHDVPVLHFRFRLVMKPLMSRIDTSSWGMFIRSRISPAQAIPSGDSSVTLSLPWRKVAKTRTSIMKILLCKRNRRGDVPPPR